MAPLSRLLLGMPGRRAGFSLIVAAALTVSACAGNDEPDFVERPAGDMYAEAEDNLQAGRFARASELFDEVERQHPYSELAPRAQLMSAFADFEDGRYDEAVAGLERFIQLNPGHPNVDYAYYLRGLSYYERISDVRRDQAMTERAQESLQEVIQRFPDTDYARDASLKLDLTYDQLAGKEMEIGRWHLQQGHYNGAINRFRTVVEEYDTTTHVPEALHRLTEAFLALGLQDQARTTASVLGYNYPGSDWYVDSYALLEDEGVRTPDERGIFQRTLDAIF